MPSQDTAHKLVSNLESVDEEVRLQAVRDMKNAIIGNRKKKSAYCSAGAVPLLVNILKSYPKSHDHDSSSIAVHAAAALGSFACGSSESMKEIVR